MCIQFSELIGDQVAVRNKVSLQALRICDTDLCDVVVVTSVIWW